MCQQRLLDMSFEVTPTFLFNVPQALAKVKSTAAPARDGVPPLRYIFARWNQCRWRMEATRRKKTSSRSGRFSSGADGGCSTLIHGSVPCPHPGRSQGHVTVMVRWKLTRLSLMSCSQGWSVSRSGAGATETSFGKTGVGGSSTAYTTAVSRKQCVSVQRQKSLTRALWSSRSHPQATLWNGQRGSGIKAVLEVLTGRSPNLWMRLTSPRNLVNTAPGP